jgi:hypothetical protein
MQPVPADFFLALIIDPENGGNIFLRNVCIFPICTALKIIRPDILHYLTY